MNSTNSSDRFVHRIKSDLSTGLKVVLVSIYVIQIIGTIFGNFLVMRAFCKFTNLRTASNSILVSLSAADMLMVVVFILRITNILGPKTSPHQLCGAVSMLSLTFNSIIILHLALISVERFIAVKFALRYHTIVTNRRSLIASVVVWLWAIGISMVFPESLKAYGMKTFTEFLRALTPCFERLHDKPFTLQSDSVRAYLIFLVTTLLVLPITIVVISYSYIFNVACKQRRQIKEEDNLQVGKLAMKCELKAARTVAIVVGLCLASFVPLLVILCLRFLTSTTVKAPHMYAAYSAASMNAWWNPLIYCWRNESFRRGFKRLLRCNP